MAVVGMVAGTPDHRSGWIVFDEPTNGLDSKGCAQVAQYLGALTITDVPCQVVVATFDTVFAEQGHIGSDKIHPSTPSPSTLPPSISNVSYYKNCLTNLSCKRYKHG
jgi:hypothetical protein